MFKSTQNANFEEKNKCRKKEQNHVKNQQIGKMTPKWPKYVQIDSKMQILKNKWVHENVPKPPSF